MPLCTTGFAGKTGRALHTRHPYPSTHTLVHTHTHTHTRAVFEYLEMEDRISVLNARLAVLHELLDMLRLQGQVGGVGGRRGVHSRPAHSPAASSTAGAHQPYVQPPSCPLCRTCGNAQCYLLQPLPISTQACPMWLRPARLGASTSAPRPAPHRRRPSTATFWR